MVTVASHKRLFTYYQREGVDNHTYYREFMAHVETIETYGGVGAVGVIPLFLAQKMKELAVINLVVDVNSPTNAERMTAIKLVRDEFLGALMLSGTNKDQFSALKTELSNQCGFGNDLYPKIGRPVPYNAQPMGGRSRARSPTRCHSSGPPRDHKD